MIKKSAILLSLGVVLFLVVGVFIYYKNTSIKIQNQGNKINPEIENLNLANLEWQEVSQKTPWQGRDSHGFVVFKNKMWLMGGVDGGPRFISPGNINYGNAPHFNDVWSSEDGVEWKQVLSGAPWGKRRSAQVVEFKGKMWLMGGWGPELGCKNDVWSSEDGVKWKLETKDAQWPAREGHQTLIFDNKIWLMGGVDYSNKRVFNDVWYSDDGIFWTRSVKNAEWKPRWDFAISVFQGKIHLVGGMDLDDNLYKDVWQSEDGITWALINNNPPFASRQGFLLFEYKDNLLVVGRLNTSEYEGGPNDVWYSEDGINWQKTKKDPPWTGREDFAAVIFKNNIWVYGGMDKNWIWKSDVWSSFISEI